MSRRGLLALGWAVALLGLASPPASMAEVTTTLSRQSSESSVAAYGDLAVWSVESATGWRLVVSEAGSPGVVLPVRARSVPFDVDLGPDRSGGVVAVYSRCQQDPSRGGNRAIQDFLPEYARGRGCDIRKFDFDQGVETRVRGASRRAVSEYLPTIWRNRVVFARIDPRRRGVRGVQPALQLVEMGRRVRRTTLPEPPAGLYAYSEPRRNQTLGGPGLVALDLRGRQLAYVWDLHKACPSHSGDVFIKEEDIRSELWLQTIGERPRRIDRACNAQRVQGFESPSFTPNRLSYVAVGLNTQLRAIDLTAGTVTNAPAPQCPTAMVQTTHALFTAQRVPCSARERGDPEPYFEVSRTVP